MKKGMTALTAVLLILVPATAHLDTPSEITYQGRLLQSGSPVTGVHSVTFRFFNAQSGGSQLWTETKNVDFGADGLYTVKLGGDFDHCIYSTNRPNMGTEDLSCERDGFFVHVGSPNVRCQYFCWDD